MKTLILIFLTIFLSSCGTIVEYHGNKNLLYKENVNKIKKGMQLTEVEKILGKPDSIILASEAQKNGAVKTLSYTFARNSGTLISTWESTYNAIGLQIDDKGRVVNIHQQMASGFYETILEDKKTNQKVSKYFNP